MQSPVLLRGCSIALMNLNDLQTIRTTTAEGCPGAALQGGVKEQLVFSGEYGEKKSRFLAFMTRVDSVEESRAFLEKVRKAHPSARHVVSAWRILEMQDGAREAVGRKSQERKTSEGKGKQEDVREAGNDTTFQVDAKAVGRSATSQLDVCILEKANDDGEPSGTSGPPVLDAVKSANLANVCLCVVRYFGGILLGPGGLKRAYAEAAKEAIEAAHSGQALVAYQKTFSARMRLDYFQLESCKHLVKHFGGTVLKQSFQEKVKLSFTLPEAASNAFKKALAEKFSAALALESEHISFGEVDP